MSNHMKKHGFPVTVERVFTRPGMDAWKLIHFHERGMQDDDHVPALECPDNWSDEAAMMFAEQAAFTSIPAGKKLLEENTVPSWLWQRRQATKLAPVETSVRHVFDRVVGAATYTGWQEGIFDTENAARAFYDEARYALAQRFIAFEPKLLATLGVNWAYGVAVAAPISPAAHAATAVDISNTLIDSIVSGSRDKTALAKWQKITHAHEGGSVDLRFADTAAEWEMDGAQPVSGFVDLMACRHNDGTVNIAALRQLVRVLVFTLDLNNLHNMQLAIGFANLAPLLMALALPYDSDAGRALAAAISAIITAESYAASAELAASRGTDLSFVEHREKVLRTLRNHRRAAYGERNDYEKISVLPTALDLNACPDLALAAAARSAWDDALQLSQNYGLRAIQTTTLAPSPALAFFMESLTQGLEPMKSLTLTHMEGDTASKLAHPSLTEGLARLDYSQTQIKVITRHLTGTIKLDKAPGVNAAALRARKFDKAAIARVEAYLPQATDIRFAFTPWIVGEFCKDVLKIRMRELENPRFDLLAYLGFTKAQIAETNAYVYGSADLKYMPELHARHASVLATEDLVSPEARIRMAASVQGFVSGATGLHLSLPLNLPVEKIEKLLLNAWRQGVRGLTIDYDETLTATLKAPAETLRRKNTLRIKPSAFAHAKAPTLPQRKSKGKTGSSVTMRGKSKSSRRNWAG